MRQAKQKTENMKDIKDYLKYYVGCEVKSQYGVSILEAVSKDGICRLGQSITVKFNEINPILRPLSDMTEDDCPAWFKEWMPDGFEILHQSSNKYHWVEIDSNANDGYLLSIHPDGSMNCECKDNGEQYAYRGAELLAHLLSKHFDLFGLIENNLAIDKTKTT